MKTVEPGSDPPPQAAEPRLTELYHMLPVALGFSVRGVMVDLNPAFVRLFGYDHVEELRGKSILTLIAPRCHEQVIANVRKRSEGKPAPQTYDAFGLRRDGSEFPFRATVGLGQSEEGPLSIVAIEDLSELRRREEELRRSELHLSRAQRVAKIGSWSRNLGTNAVRWSRETRRLLGIPVDSPVTLDDLLARVHPDDRAMIVRRIAQNDVGTQGYDYRVIRPDGSEIICHAEAELMSEGETSAGELVGTVQDVTESRRHETRIQDLLSSEQAARHEAEAANRAKDTFLAMLSHELRTPLTSILAWAEMLQSGTLNEDRRRRAIDVILRSGRLQAKLIDDLLDLSRIQSGKASILANWQALSPLVEAALGAQLAAISAKQLRLTTEFDVADRLAYVDAARLQQVLANLITNAIKFTNPAGEIRIALRYEGDEAQILIRDSGVGIEPSFMTHIFHHFTQADSALTRSYGGLGLGLAISSRLMRLMGGDLDAESPGKDQGATFTVRIPTRLQASVAPVSEAGESRTACNAVERIRGRAVLLVDDDPNTLEAFSEVLGRCGLEVRTASSIGEALRCLEEFTPDLLITDLAMPGETGYDLVARIRQSGGKTPAIALTAHAGPEEKKRVLSSGFQAFVIKPASIEQLSQTIADVIDT
jgi:PAS domain S-box-containing protein